MSKYMTSLSPVLQALRFGAIMMTSLVVATVGLFVVMF